MNDIPAFPVTGRFYSTGMTLRDYFAGAAMQSFFAIQITPVTRDWTREQMATWAYATADAMLKAREAK